MTTAVGSAHDASQAASVTVDPFGVVLNDFLADLSFCPADKKPASAAAIVQHQHAGNESQVEKDEEKETPEAAGGTAAESSSMSSLFLLSDAELTFSSSTATNSTEEPSTNNGQLLCENHTPEHEIIKEGDASCDDPHQPETAGPFAEHVTHPTMHPNKADVAAPSASHALTTTTESENEKKAHDRAVGDWEGLYQPMHQRDAAEAAECNDEDDAASWLSMLDAPAAPHVGMPTTVVGPAVDDAESNDSTADVVGGRPDLPIDHDNASSSSTDATRSSAADVVGSPPHHESFCGVKAWLEASGNLLERHLQHKRTNQVQDVAKGEKDDDDHRDGREKFDGDEHDDECEEVSVTESEEVDDATSDAGLNEPSRASGLPQHIDVQAWLEASGGLLEKHLQHRQRQISQSCQADDVNATNDSSGETIALREIETDSRSATNEILSTAQQAEPTTDDVTSWLQTAGERLERHLQQRLQSLGDETAQEGDHEAQCDNALDDDASVMTEIEIVDDDGDDDETKRDCTLGSRAGITGKDASRAVASIDIEQWLANSGNRLEKHLAKRQEQMDVGVNLDSEGPDQELPSNVRRRGVPTLCVSEWLETSGCMLEQHLLQRQSLGEPSQLHDPTYEATLCVNDDADYVPVEDESAQNAGDGRSIRVAPVVESVDTNANDMQVTTETELPDPSMVPIVNNVRDWLQDTSNILERKIQQRRQSMTQAVYAEPDSDEDDEIAVVESEQDNISEAQSVSTSDSSAASPHGIVEDGQSSDDESEAEVVVLDEGVPSLRPQENVRSWLKDTAAILERKLEARKLDEKLDILSFTARRETTTSAVDSRPSGESIKTSPAAAVRQQECAQSTNGHDTRDATDIRSWLQRSAAELEVRLQERNGAPGHGRSPEYDEVTVLDDDVVDSDDGEEDAAAPSSPALLVEQQSKAQNKRKAKTAPQKVDVRNWLETTASLLDKKLQTQNGPSDDPYDEITIIDEPETEKRGSALKNAGFRQQGLDEETVIEEIEDDDEEDDDDVEDDDEGSSDAMDSSSSAYEEEAPKITKAELPANVLEWMQSTALLLRQLEQLKGDQGGDREGGDLVESGCLEVADSAESSGSDGDFSTGDCVMNQERSSTNLDMMIASCGDDSWHASEHSRSQHSSNASSAPSKDGSSENGDNDSHDEGEEEDGDSSPGDVAASSKFDRECNDDAWPSGRLNSSSSNLVPSTLNKSSFSKLPEQKMDLGGLGNFLESKANVLERKIQERQQNYCKSVHLEADDDESESDEDDRNESSAPMLPRLASVPETDAGSVTSGAHSAAKVPALSPSPVRDPAMSSATSPETPSSPIRRAPRASIPAAPYSFSAVSVSFLAPNVKASTATKVFEEALRILRPGGHVYLVDYDGRTVEKLPQRWRGLLRHVDQFDPDEMQRHGMQEEEIRKILSCVGSTKSTQRLDQGYSLARWVGVLPPNFSLY